MISYIYSILLCLFAYDLNYIPPTLERIDNCKAVIEISQEYETDPFIVTSLMISESTGITPTPKYRRSARGPLQIKPYWCENKTFEDCDLLSSGVRALVLIRRCSKIDWENLTCHSERKTRRPWNETLCIYGQNKPCSETKKGDRYSRYILSQANKIRKSFRSNI